MARKSSVIAQWWPPFAGFTLMELLLGVALLGALLAMVLPRYDSLRQYWLLKSAGHALYMDLMLLKSEAIKRQQNSQLIVFNSDQSNWCYRINLSGLCQSCQDSCATLAGRRGVDANEFHTIELSANYPSFNASSKAITFSAIRGTTPSGHIELQLGELRMRIITSNFGRVRSCGPYRVGEMPTCL